MKRVVSGKTYDTATAIEVGRNDNGMSRSNFRWIDEALYKTGKGTFFLAGRGGPLTPYRQTVGQNCWTSGSGLEVLSDAAALMWAEEYCEVDVIAEHFAIEEG